VRAAPVSVGALVFNLFLIGVLLLVNGSSNILLYPDVPLFLAAVILVFLLRTLSTRYILDSDRLVAWRLWGSRRIPLEEVRRIRLANIRDIGGVGFFGVWGWRGRMWSPIENIGRFDGVYTVPRGVLVFAEPVPLFLSPPDPEEFVRELSRRVRSAGVTLEE
jgi:hypothetical protein